MKDMSKIDKLISYAKTLNKTKMYNWNISEVRISKIWTKRQQDYLDQKFGAIDKRFEDIDKRFEAIDKRFEKLGDRATNIEFVLKKILGVLDKHEKLLIKLLDK